MRWSPPGGYRLRDRLSLALAGARDWLDDRRRQFARWLLDGAVVPRLRVLELKVGRNTITMDTNNRLVFTTYAAPTTLGQLALDPVDGRAAVFVAGAASKMSILPDHANTVVGELVYHFSANFAGVGTGSAWVSTADRIAFAVSALEYVFGGNAKVPNKVMVLVAPKQNGVNPGTVTVAVTRNGVDTAASIAFVNGDTSATQDSDTGSYSAADGWGLRIQSTAASGIFEATVVVRLLASL